MKIKAIKRHVTMVTFCSPVPLISAIVEYMVTGAVINNIDKNVKK